MQKTENAPKKGFFLVEVYVTEKYDLVAKWMEKLTLEQLDRFEALLKVKGAIKKRTLLDGQIILNVMDRDWLLNTEEAFA